MNDLITLVVEQFPTLAGLIVLAVVLYRQNEKTQETNDRLVERIINLTVEMRDCVKNVTAAVVQQEETD